MFRRWAAAPVALLIALTACSSGGDTKVIAARKPTTTSAPSTSTTVTEPPPPAPAPAAAPAAPAVRRPQRVKALPGTFTPRAPKPARAAPRGPQSTGRIIIPRLGLDHATYEGIEMSTIDRGPSHWPGTAEPGDVGNTVFPGHRTTNTRPFFNIDQLRNGDQVIFVRAGGRFTYEVTETFTVYPDETWIADPTDTPTFTIFACHPKGSAKQRYVAKGRLVRAERTQQAPPPPPPSNGGGGGGGGQPPPESPPTTACTLCLPPV